MQKLGGSSFSSKYLKFNLDFINAAKNREKKLFVCEVIASELVLLSSVN